MKLSFIRIIILFSMIMSFYIVKSQGGFIQGYVLDNRGDTIKGFIDYKNWGKNPKTIQFKKSLNGQIKKYSVKDLTGFYAANEYYTRAEVNINERNYDIGVVSVPQNTQFQKDTVFLLTLIKGDKSLYQVRLPDRELYYIYQVGDTFLTYEYSQYVLMRDEHRYKAENNKYRIQMLNYFNDCPTIEPKLLKTSYNLNSIKKAYLEYYKCRDIAPVYECKSEKIMEYGLAGGISLTKLRFTDAVPDYMAKIDYEDSWNYFAAIFINVVFPRNFEHWSIYNEINLTSLKTSAIYNDFVHENWYSLITSYYETSFLKFVCMYRYRYLSGKWTIFANAGPALGFAVKYKDYKKIETHFYDQVSSRIEDETGVKRSFEAGLAAGIGVGFWHFTLEARYDKPFFPSYSSPTNRFVFLLGYRIK